MQNAKLKLGKYGIHGDGEKRNPITGKANPKEDKCWWIFINRFNDANLTEREKGTERGVLEIERVGGTRGQVEMERKIDRVRGKEEKKILYPDQ